MSSQPSGAVAEERTAAMAREFDRLIRQTSKSPGQIETRARAAGILGLSQASISRCRGVGNGRLPRRDALEFLFELAGEHELGRQRVRTLLEQARQAGRAAADDAGALPDDDQSAPPIKAQVGPMPSASHDDEVPHLKRRAHGRRFLVIALAATLVVVAAFAAIVATVARSGGTRAPEPAGSGRVAGAAAPCNRYVVTARDLWVRDESGTPTDQQLLNGQEVTVLNRHSRSGPPDNWLVTTSDRLTGWVDRDYLAPLCTPASVGTVSRAAQPATP
ncbi:hypothetical protein [Frankia sp. CiP3]|uniref:hypothetical protein n=1 Tax=Frankia sp. CiP3 TaxID=2880971 RepID=UPI001EF6B88B|nr:hypothetical protein [Frankia sp. CiP3]